MKSTNSLKEEQKKHEYYSKLSEEEKRKEELEKTLKAEQEKKVKQFEEKERKIQHVRSLTTHINKFIALPSINKTYYLQTLLCLPFNKIYYLQTLFCLPLINLQILFRVAFK